MVNDNDLADVSKKPLDEYKNYKKKSRKKANKFLDKSSLEMQ